MNYDITYNDKIVGTAAIEKTGLYWDIRCICQIDSTEFLQVYGADTKSATCLGILVPDTKGLQLKKSVPCNKIDLENVRFYVKLKHPKSNIPFIPIYPDEPFGYLDRLKDSHMERSREDESVRGIYLTPSQQDSDPNRKTPDK